jgi:crotonobetainyl-CoA:carnitine CoA-transferase CaiB-like acyl-CoA transferase
LANGEEPGRQGRGHLSIPTYRAFACRDGIEIVVAANVETMWPGLCRAVGAEDLIGDPRFVTNVERLAHRNELDVELEYRFSTYDASEVLDRLQENGVPSSRINNLQAAFAEPQAIAREMVNELAGADGSTVRVVGNPVKVVGVVDTFSYPPALGADSRETLTSLLGLSDSVYDGLVANGAIGEPSARTRLR